MPYKTLNPAEAKELLEGEASWAYVDVRTVEEFEAGHPPGAFNIPIAVRSETGGLAPNPEFVPVMAKAFAKDAALVIGCAAGGRSRHACEQLITEGFANLVNMHGGFSGARDETGRVTEEGWAGCGYPTETGSEAERTYEALRARG